MASAATARLRESSAQAGTGCFAVGSGALPKSSCQDLAKATWQPATASVATPEAVDLCIGSPWADFSLASSSGSAPCG